MTIEEVRKLKRNDIVLREDGKQGRVSGLGKYTLWVKWEDNDKTLPIRFEDAKGIRVK